MHDYNGLAKLGRFDGGELWLSSANRSVNSAILLQLEVVLSRGIHRFCFHLFVYNLANQSTLALYSRSLMAGVYFCEKHTRCKQPVAVIKTVFAIPII